MNLNIYINQVLEKLGFLFYNQYIEEKSFMIQINNSAYYHIFKMTTAYYRHIGLIYMGWLVQFLDLNPIEDLWQIIKIQISAQHY